MEDEKPRIYKPKVSPDKFESQNGDWIIFNLTLRKPKAATISFKVSHKCRANDFYQVNQTIHPLRVGSGEEGRWEASATLFVPVPAGYRIDAYNDAGIEVANRVIPSDLIAVGSKAIATDEHR